MFLGGTFFIDVYEPFGKEDSQPEQVVGIHAYFTVSPSICMFVGGKTPLNLLPVNHQP